MLVSIDEETLHGDHKKRAEFAALSIDGPEIVLLDEQPEEFLREIFCILRLVHRIADMGVKRIPVKAAQVLEGLSRARRVLLARQHDLGPARRHKTARLDSRKF